MFITLNPPPTKAQLQASLLSALTEVDDEPCMGCEGPLDHDHVYCLCCEDRRCQNCGEVEGAAFCRYCTLTTL